MEARKIVVMETSNHKKSVIMSAATTLAELKRDFDKNGINYTNMTFYEGVSKTELKLDNSILPHDVPHKGGITNELAFILTTTNKKIKSGAYSRTELYKIILDNNLKEAIKDKYNKNYTNCGTAVLEEFVNNALSTCGSVPTPKEVNKAEEAASVPTLSAKNVSTHKLVLTIKVEDNVPSITNAEFVGTNSECKCQAKKVISTSDDMESPYSEAELDKMISELN